jgi:hypothetical protein
VVDGMMLLWIGDQAPAAAVLCCCGALARQHSSRQAAPCRSEPAKSATDACRCVQGTAGADCCNLAQVATCTCNLQPATCNLRIMC